MSTESKNVFKIFVGNVPFQCDTEEFKSCFTEFKGYLNAELIKRFNSNLSRGFGFVIFSNESDAEYLLDQKNIIFKDRILRFSKYFFNDNKQLDANSKNMIYVSNIPVAMTVTEFKNTMQKFGNIGICYINTDIRTGLPKGSGVVELIDNICYQKLLAQKEFEYNNTVIKISCLKSKRTNFIKNKYANYVAGFNDGFKTAIKKMKN